MGTRYLMHRIRKSAHAANAYDDVPPPKPAKKKKISKDKGDYVDFEEIE